MHTKCFQMVWTREDSMKLSENNSARSRPRNHDETPLEKPSPPRISWPFAIAYKASCRRLVNRPPTHPHSACQSRGDDKAKPRTMQACKGMHRDFGRFESR
ncbi:hypothetical protein G6O67_000457 [Ophiocordyceps sinensis]|uniref:Uncharacterized protein n=1 Tax=Ophiocordyceps sinensis TaxID=72228 RepID=A0A8H4PZ65_9HYPO|nr:hypothetical protein G6O67_000457 [Ophiocordyceps sinensis]